MIERSRLIDEQLAQPDEVARTWDTNLNKRFERADAAMRHLPALLAEVVVLRQESGLNTRLTASLLRTKVEREDENKQLQEQVNAGACEVERLALALGRTEAALAAEREAREKADELAATRLQWQRLAENRLWELTQLQKQLATEQARFEATAKSFDKAMEDFYTEHEHNKALRGALVEANWIISKLALHESIAILVRGHRPDTADIERGAKARQLIDAALAASEEK
jgi:hypothetical protein